MGSLNLDDIQPGMTLADDVKDKSGRILLTAGQKVTDKHLKIFKMWGILEADITDNKDDGAPKVEPEIDPLPNGEVQKEADEFFRHTDLDHPAVKEMYRLCIARIVRKSGGVAHAD